MTSHRYGLRLEHDVCTSGMRAQCSNHAEAKPEKRSAHPINGPDCEQISQLVLIRSFHYLGASSDVLSNQQSAMYDSLGLHYRREDGIRTSRSIESW